MVNKLIREARTSMQNALDFMIEDFKTVRTGRANAAMVEDLDVLHYGQHMPLKALAGISTPDGKTISIQAWDQTAVSAIEKAITDAKDLNLNPVSDGRMIHINVPPMTEERRQQMAKLLNEKVENANIALRNARHEALNEGKKLLKAKEIAEDEQARLEKHVEESMKEYKEKVEDAAKAKKEEIMQV